MANGHGGERTPSRPAAVSGPGRHSRRTDGAPKMDLPDAKYGEAAAFEQAQAGGQLGGGPGSPAAAPAQSAPLSMPTPLGAPSQFADQPVTAGADAGDGPGSDALGLPDSSNEAADIARRYGPYVPMLVRMADDPTASQDFRNQVRYLLSRLP